MWPDVQVRHLPGERLGLQLGPGWAIQGQPYASPLTAVGTRVGPRGHTHHPAVHTHSSARLSQACVRAHTHTHTHHGHAQTPRYIHRHTVSLYDKDTCAPPQPPPAVRILYPRGQAWKTTLLPGSHLLQASLSHPVWSSNTPLLWSLPSRSTQGVAQHVGQGRGPQSTPSFPDSPPSPLLPWDLSHPRPGASRPPVGPSS